MNILSLQAVLASMHIEPANKDGRSDNTGCTSEVKQAAAVLIVGRGSACGRLQGCGRRAAAARSVCSPAAHTGAGEKYDALLQI